MDGFLKDFEKMVDDKTLADNIELPASSEFEGKDTFVNMYMSEFDGVVKDVGDAAGDVVEGVGDAAADVAEGVSDAVGGNDANNNGK